MMMFTSSGLPSLRKAVLAGLFSIVLAACGGGGSDSDNGGQQPPPPSATGTLTGSVKDAATGQAIEGVRVAVGSQSVQTNAAGAYSLPVPTGNLIVSFRKDGYAEQTKLNGDVRNAGDSSILNVPMVPFAASTAYGGNTQTITVPNSPAAVTLPADAMRRADGSAPQGAVTVRLAPINPATDINVMPGSLVTVQSGATVPIESFGALTVDIVDASGAQLNLGTGKIATIRIAAVSRGQTLPPTIPLFHFNTATGQWVQEGTATLAGTGAGAYYEGQVTHFSTWNADRVTETVFVRGCVRNTAGQPAAGALITSEGVNYIGSASVTADASGNFRVAVKRNARVALTATAGGTVGSSAAFDIGAVDVDASATCLTLTPAAVSIKLSWGERPNDLDSHLYAPNAQGTPEEIYFGNEGSLAQAPFANLDVDDISGFGPEYITISRVARNATYRYWVFNFSGTFDPGQTASPARVEVNVRGALSVFTPPAGEAANVVWHAFDLVVDGNCNISVRPVNAWLAADPVAPASLTAAPSYCQ
jgi:uncharacterized protein YfaP (DUF2135 family)